MSKRTIGIPPFARDVNSGALVFMPPEEERYDALEARIEKLEALLVFTMHKLATLEASRDELYRD